MMRDYYHPQPYPPMAPYLAESPSFYARPRFHPNAYRRRLRDFLGQLVGFVIVGLALATLFLNSPNEYITDVDIPAEVITPKPLGELWNRKADNSQQEREPVSPMPEIDEPAPAPAPAPEQAPVLNSSQVKGTYVVQLFAAPSQTRAKNYYYEIKATNENLFRPLRPGIQRARVRGRGLFHRLYVFPFEDRAAAQEFCETLRQRNRDCFVKRR